MNLQETTRLRTRLRSARKAPVVESVPLPSLGQLEEAFDRFIVVKHQDTAKHVRGMTELQRAIFRQMTCFRLDADGERVAGADIILKSRKIYATSLILGLIALCMCIIPGFCAVTVLQKTSGSTGMEKWLEMLGILKRLPKEWTGSVGEHTGESLILANGSMWILTTAGSGRQVAEKIGRSGNPHLIHLSEPGAYQYPSTVWAAVHGALSEKSGWCVAEGTPPADRDHWFAREYRAAREGTGVFQKAIFCPWYVDTKRVIHPTDARYDKVMTPQWEGHLGQKVLEEERLLKLAQEQIAWRRWTFFRGTSETIAEAHREFPETDETCFISREPTDSYLDARALALVDAQVVEPTVRHELHKGWIGEAWTTQAEFALVTTDSAAFRGEDCSAVVAIDPWTRDILGIVHGQTTARGHADGIRWLLKTLGCEHPSRHVVAPERNRDELVGLVGELLKDKKLRLYYRAGRDGKVSDQPGYIVSRFNRSAFIEELVNWVEGEVDPDHPENFGPRCRFLSSKVASELRSLVRLKGKVVARAGKHDDLVIPLAGALIISNHLKLPRRSAKVADLVTRTPVQTAMRDGVRTYGRPMPS